MLRTSSARTRVVAALALGPLVLAACGSSKPASGGGSQTITLYSAQHEQTTDALVKAFTAQTGIKVNIRNDDEDVFTAQIEQEGSRSPADVFYTENSPWLEQLDAKGLLAKTDATTLAQVPAADSAATGDWVGVSARMSVLVYNTSKLKASDLPTSILGLADPKWKGKLELAPSETDFWPLISSIDKSDGQAAALSWLDAVKSNAGSEDNAPDNETVVSDVNSGAAEIGIINHYYWYRLRAELGAGGMHSALAYFAPGDVGYVQDISGAAILKSSKHQAAAQKFLAFLTSDAGQHILATGESFEYPIAPGVAANPQLPALTSLHPNPYSVADLGTGEDAKTLLQRAQLL